MPTSSLGKLTSQLRYRHFLLLLAIDQHRNLHRAAQVVHLAQPTASKLVHNLEVLFGAPLFDRLPTGMRPTEHGAVVLSFARHALGDLERLATDLDHRRLGRDSELIIGATTDLLPDIVAQAIARIKQERPMQAIKLLCDPTETIVDRLIDGPIDMVVGYFGDEFKARELSYSFIGRETFCIVVRQHHPLCYEPHLSVDRLERAAWILHPHSWPSPQPVEQIFHLLGMESPPNILASGSLHMTVTLLLQSDAITILPESLIRAPLQVGQLVRLPISTGDNEFEFGILTRRDEPLGAIASDFADILRRIANSKT
jgi:DNA-binding transcriptional LysR family regulator